MNRSNLSILASVLFIAIVGTSALWRKHRAEVPTVELPERPVDPSLRTLSALSQEVLASPDSFALYSINPDKFFPGTNELTQEHFHRYEILGRLEITRKEQQEKLLSALYKGMEEARGETYKCFNPRHGITATKGTNKIELLICFQCLSGYEFIPASPQDTRAGRGRYFITSGTPRDAFNASLKQAKIPMAKEP
jgi:hypothetical protein